MCREGETLNHSAKSKMALSTLYAQSSAVYAKGKVGSLQEPEVVDDLNEVESPDTVELIHICMYRDCNSTHKTCQS